MKTFTATPNDAGQTARKFLQKAAPLLPGGLLHKAFRKKRVKVGGKAVAIDYVIKNGDIIELYINDEFFAEKATRPTTYVELEIVHENPSLLIVNKPAGTLSHPDLIDAVTAYLITKGEYNPILENTFAPALCNRLDRNTSGLIIAAKTAAALRTTNDQIKNREIKKFYLARHGGTLPAAEGTLTHHHKKDERRNLAIIKDEPFSGSKPAKLRYKFLSPGLAEIELITGRFHQIRAQLAHIGCPLTGDRKYKSKSPGTYALTAYKLILPDKTEITASSAIISIAGQTFAANTEYLALEEKQLIDITPLQNLTRLRELYLCHNKIADITPIRTLTALKTLSFWDNQVTDITPLSALTNLTELGLGGNNIIDLSPLRTLTALTETDIEHNQITDVTPLQSLTQLQKLYLSDNQIKDITPLKNLINLTELGIYNNQIKDITPLYPLTKLTKLDLRGNPLPPTQIDALRHALPNCEINF